MIVVASATSSQPPRLGVTVSRRVGNAVVRNRVKRRIREWFRRARADLQPGAQVVVIARREAAVLHFEEAERLLSTLLARAVG